MKNYRIGIVGSGGVGGYFGALLARQGQDVYFLARGKHLSAIREKGLFIESIDGDFNVTARAYDEPSEIGCCDIILFCVKSYDTESTANFISPMIGDGTVIISLQNGVSNEDVIGRMLGREKVLGGVAFIGSRIKAPGVILHTAAGSLSIGEMGGGSSSRAEDICSFFQGAGINMRLSGDIKKAMWRKMVWNCGFNAITALTGCSVGEVLSDESARELVEAAMQEVVSIAIAMGVDLNRDLPAKTISHTEKEGDIRTSMLIDMENGSRMEIEALNGTVCEQGKKKGVETPFNKTLYSLIAAVNRKRGF